MQCVLPCLFYLFGFPVFNLSMTVRFIYVKCAQEQNNYIDFFLLSYIFLFFTCFITCFSAQLSVGVVGFRGLRMSPYLLVTCPQMYKYLYCEKLSEAGMYSQVRALIWVVFGSLHCSYPQLSASTHVFSTNQSSINYPPPPPPPPPFRSLFYLNPRKEKTRNDRQEISLL